MNALGILIVWAALQVTLLCSATIVVYLFVRRRSPGAGVWPTFAGLMLSGLLTVGIVSPWPRWSLEKTPEATAALATRVPAASQALPRAVPNGLVGKPAGRPEVAARSPRPAEPSASMRETLASWWRSADRQLTSAPAAEGSTGRRWTIGVAVACLLLIALGMVRLLAGWLGVRECLRRSRPIADDSLSASVTSLAGELGCRGAVELRESRDIVCAATVGGRRAVLLLPNEWRSWTLRQRRAVLAHELAHVASGDAATWLAAQLALLLQFYHPLAHWLANRLRLEQELAADAAAARVTGGAQDYLSSLAELAVRNAERPVPWPVRTFLPSPGTLLRRIHMLRDTHVSTRRSSPARYALAVMLIVVCAGLVAGFRPSPSAFADSRKTSAADAAEDSSVVEVSTRMKASRQNLKTIAAAFHRYHNEHGHFPPPVLRGPDGKTPYSWRVAILPAMGEQELYDEYDRNQRWNSSDNLKVLDKIPEVFRHPADDTESTNAGYFVFSGEHTAVGEPDGDGIAMRDIWDGTSNTLLAVEAQRDIAWTRPKDIAFVEYDTPTSIGGWFDGGFFAATSDGWVSYFRSPPDEQSLRAAITCNRNEIVDIDAMTLDVAVVEDSVSPTAALDSSASDAQATAPKVVTILKYGDGKPDDKKSIAGTGEMIRFELPDETQKLLSLRIHCARYGTPQPPKESAEFSIVSEDGSEIIHQEDVPYSSFKRGVSRWTTIRFQEPVEVPKAFWVILDFDAHQTKGVYVSYDTSTGGKHSRTGVPGGEMKEVNTGGDWMIRAILSKPE